MRYESLENDPKFAVGDDADNPPKRRRRTRERVSQHHVEAIRRRAALRGIAMGELAATAGVSRSFLYGLMSGDHVRCCSRGELLRAVGLPADAANRTLWLEGRAIALVLAMTERGDAEALQAAVTALDQLEAGEHAG